ncbi:MAG: hypothetical protein ACI31A_03495 [Candidatus Limisoma sp.]
MRLLAHYTVFAGDVFHLHNFDVTPGGITHRPVVAETAHTEFVEGILVIGSADIAALRARLRDIAQANGSAGIANAARLICHTLDESDTNYKPGHPVGLIKITYPLFLVSEIKPK